MVLDDWQSEKVLREIQNEIDSSMEGVPIDADLSKLGEYAKDEPAEEEPVS